MKLVLMLQLGTAQTARKSLRMIWIKYCETHLDDTKTTSSKFQRRTNQITINKLQTHQDKRLNTKLGSSTNSLKWNLGARSHNKIIWMKM